MGCCKSAPSGALDKEVEPSSTTGASAAKAQSSSAPSAVKADDEGSATAAFEGKGQEPEVDDTASAGPRAPVDSTPSGLDLDYTLQVCRDHLSVGDALAAERALVTFIEELEGSDLAAEQRDLKMQHMRSSEEYVQTLSLLRILQGAIDMALGSSPDSEADWTLGTEVGVNLPALGVHVDEATARALGPEGAKVRIHHRKNGKHLQLRITSVLPSRTPSGWPSVAGFLAMYAETGLWDSWHPVIHGHGPVELTPRGAHHNVWHVITSLLLKKAVEIQVMRTFLVQEAGVFVISIDGTPPEHEMWKTYPPPGRISKVPGCTAYKIVAIPQENTTLFTVSVSATMDKEIPQWLINLLVTWLLPELTRRMLKAGAQSLTVGGPHMEHIQADKLGIYQAIRKLSEQGAELERTKCHPRFSPGNMPSPDIIRNRKGNLLSMDEAWTVPHPPMEPTESEGAYAL
mmetsp:Transcript_27972/g.63282  ORF Transcript_27972/g.63282 Transcript_27972/m.63282 type:complete len:458 (-) Transcript_27972:103-1476(-)